MMTESHQHPEVRLISSFIADTKDSSTQSIELVTESDKSIHRKKPAIIPRKHMRNKVKDGSIIVEHLQPSENQCTANSSSIYLVNLETQNSPIFKSGDQNSCYGSTRNSGGIPNKFLISHEVKISPYDESSYCISRSLLPSKCEEHLLPLSPAPAPTTTTSAPPPAPTSTPTTATLLPAPFDELDFYTESPSKHGKSRRKCDVVDDVGNLRPEKNTCYLFEENDEGIASPYNLSHYYKATAGSSDKNVKKTRVSDLHNKHDRIKDKHDKLKDNTGFGGYDEQDALDNNDDIRGSSSGYNKLDAYQDNMHVQSNDLLNKHDIDVPMDDIYALSDGYGDKRNISTSNTRGDYNMYHESITSPDYRYPINEDGDDNVLSPNISYTFYEDYHQNTLPKNNMDVECDNYNSTHNASEYNVQPPPAGYHKQALPKDSRHILSNSHETHGVYTDNRQVPNNVIREAVVSSSNTYSQKEGIEKSIPSDAIHVVYEDYHENVVPSDNTHALYEDFIKDIPPDNCYIDYYEILPDTYSDGHRNALFSGVTPSDNYPKNSRISNEEYYKNRHVTYEEDGIPTDNTQAVYDNYDNYPPNFLPADDSYILYDNYPDHVVPSNRNQRRSINGYQTIIPQDNVHSLYSDTKPSSVKEPLYSNNNLDYISPESAQKWYMDSQRDKVSPVHDQTSNVETQRNEIPISESQAFPVDCSENNNTPQKVRGYTRLLRSSPSPTFTEYSPREKAGGLTNPVLTHPEMTDIIYDPLYERESRNFRPMKITAEQEYPENFQYVYVTDSANQMDNGDHRKMRSVNPSECFIYRESYENGEEIPSDGYQNKSRHAFVEEFDYSFRDVVDTQHSSNGVGEIIILPNDASEKGFHDYNQDEEYVDYLLAVSPLPPRRHKAEISDRRHTVEYSAHNEDNAIIYDPLNGEEVIVDDVFYMVSPENKRSRTLPSKNSCGSLSGYPSHIHDKEHSRGKQQPKTGTGQKSSSNPSTDNVPDVFNSSFQDKRRRPIYFDFSQQSPLYYEDIDGSSSPLSLSSSKVNSDYYEILSPLAASTPDGVSRCSGKYNENTKKQYSRRHSSLATDESGFVDCISISGVSSSADCHRNSEKLSIHSSSNSEEYEYSNIDVFPAYVDNSENYVNNPATNDLGEHTKKKNRVSFGSSKETGCEHYANIDDFNSILRISNKYNYDDDSSTKETTFSYHSGNSPKDFQENPRKSARDFKENSVSSSRDFKDNPVKSSRDFKKDSNSKRVPTQQENDSKVDLYMNSEDAANYINSLRINPGGVYYETKCNSPAKGNPKDMSAIERGFLKLSEALENTFRKPPSKITFASDRAKRKNFYISGNWAEKIPPVKMDESFDKYGYEDYKTPTSNPFKLKNFLKKKKKKLDTTIH